MTRVGSRVGVCSWSLQPAGAAALAERVGECGVTAVQLALDPLRTGAMPQQDVVECFRAGGISVLSGMLAMRGEDYSSLDSIRRTGGIVPDATWDENEKASRANAQIASELGITLVTFHAGFVPHERGDARARLMDRLRRMAQIFGEHDIRIALETGQEDAHTLLALLVDLEPYGIGVNFDPANMILYGMGDPVSAVTTLSRFIRQVHIKDAVATSQPGTWGREVRAGTGDVKLKDFFEALRDGNVECDFVIEREAGGARIDDVRAAVTLLAREGIH